MAKAGTSSKVNLIPLVLAKMVAINQKISRIAYLISISESDSQSAIKILITIGMLIKIKKVFRFSTFVKNIATYQAKVPAKNHHFSPFFLVTVRVMPINA